MSALTPPHAPEAPAAPAAPLCRRIHASVRVSRLAAVGGAVVATAVDWTASGPPAGHRLLVQTGAGGAAHPVGLAAVIIVSLLAGLAAWALLAWLERHARRPRRAWISTAAAVLLLSLAGPLSAGQGATTTWILVSLHLTTGIVLIAALGRTARAG